MKSRLRVIRNDSLTQTLVKEVMIGKYVIYRTSIDEEKIPTHAVICSACFGDTGEWVSKFAPFDANGIKEVA